MSNNTLTPEQQNALRVVDLITGTGGPDAYLESLQPISANYDTSSIDADFKLLPPIRAPISIEFQVKPNDPFPGHCTFYVNTIPKLIGAPTWHGSGFASAPGAVEVHVKDWSLFLSPPWSLDKLVGASGIKFVLRRDPELPGNLLCDIISGCLLVGTFGGPLGEKEIEALDRSTGVMHWWKTYPYPPFQ